MAYFQCVCAGCGWCSRPMFADACMPKRCPKCFLGGDLRMQVYYQASDAPGTLNSLKLVKGGAR